MIATALQALGAALVTLGLGFAFGWSAGCLAAGVALLVFGVAEELG